MRVFFRPLVLFRSSTGASVEGGIDLRRGLAQNFLKPPLRSSGSVRRPSQQRVELALLSTYWLTKDRKDLTRARLRH